MSVLMGSLSRNAKSLACSNPFKPEVEAEVEIAEQKGEPGPSGVDVYSADKLIRQFSKTSFYSDDDEEQDDGKVGEDFVVGPLLPLKEQLEKDKEDESLRRWKEKLLGSLDFDAMGGRLEPVVKIVSLGILSRGRPDMTLSIPFVPNSRGFSFTLKEGSRYSLKFSFTVYDNIVSGLTYINTVWKSGVRVDNSRVMLGTFSPRQEPYAHVMEEETTPSGLLARGSYSARTKFVDDDERCHLDLNYTFEIRKDW